MIRVLLADDQALVRGGLRKIVDGEPDMRVVAESVDGLDAVDAAARSRPDVAVVDIRMPPGHADDGLRAAETIRQRYPGTGVLLLSQYAEPAYARELLANRAEGVGYLLKDRVSDLTGFADAVRRIAAGEVVLDPEITV